ncbi:IS66 family insertion sequence element accessory protein TnpB [Stutzerimonas stutzeri]|nr:IS66 family insertion sequence element accessory protein TnpB [Stutzerimonas stutzeri]MDI9729465.1 IS66 family insertion sequence element accessory protein TnpB [Stutzerimonas stutzeri]MDI9750187.1 IS66 family insertion sequence element accessory protein TnpB [Stutzerimonas stutzeri]
MIRIERIWLATEPLDMRAGTETALARVVQVFGSAQPHCAYLFTNKRQPDEGAGARWLRHLAGRSQAE